MEEKKTLPVLLLRATLEAVNHAFEPDPQQPSRIRFAVIVNDIYGEINIDATVIARDGVVGQRDDSLVPLQNGCICCTLRPT